VEEKLCKFEKSRAWSVVTFVRSLQLREECRRNEALACVMVLGC
jgi:hypothetical protein